jgi:hypothetical protein
MAVGRNIDADEVAQIAGSAKHEIGREPFQLAFISARRLVDRRRDHRQVDEEAVRRPDHFADAGLSDGEVKRHSKAHDQAARQKATHPRFLRSKGV